MKVIIDPASDIHYASFYILGLRRVYGRKNIHFSSKYFRKFRHNNHFFSFVLKDKDSLNRIIIDFTDSRNVDQDALNWSDVYGKINMDPEVHYHKKVICIGPSFGIRIYSAFETICLAVMNFLRSSGRITDKRRFFADYKSQFLRPRLIDYKDNSTKDNFIYFLASIWKNEEETNQFRANFIRACQKVDGLDFYGGFVKRTVSEVPGFEELTVGERVKMRRYLSKILESEIVFNTPAVKGCHGWKLAEYFSMGKAILSTPLLRSTPEPLVDKQHYLLTTGDEEDIFSKLNFLMNNKELIKSMGKEARAYFENNLEPSRVIYQMVEHIGNHG